MYRVGRIKSYLDVDIRTEVLEPTTPGKNKTILYRDSKGKYHAIDSIFDNIVYIYDHLINDLVLYSEVKTVDDKIVAPVRPLDIPLLDTERERAKAQLRSYHPPIESKALDQAKKQWVDGFIVKDKKRYYYTYTFDEVYQVDEPDLSDPLNKDSVYKLESHEVIDEKIYTEIFGIYFILATAWAYDQI